MDYLQKQFGYNVKYNSAITYKDFQVWKNYDAVFIGIGLGKTDTLNIKGENLWELHRAVEFIELLRRMKHNVRVGRQRW